MERLRKISFGVFKKPPPSPPLMPAAAAAVMGSYYGSNPLCDQISGVEYDENKHIYRGPGPVRRSERQDALPDLEVRDMTWQNGQQSPQARCDDLGVIYNDLYHHHDTFAKQTPNTSPGTVCSPPLSALHPSRPRQKRGGKPDPVHTGANPLSFGPYDIHRTQEQEEERRLERQLQQQLWQPTTKSQQVQTQPQSLSQQRSYCSASHSLSPPHRNPPISRPKCKYPPTPHPKAHTLRPPLRIDIPPTYNTAHRKIYSNTLGSRHNPHIVEGPLVHRPVIRYASTPAIRTAVRETPHQAVPGFVQHVPVLNTGYKDHQPRLPHEHAYRPSGGVHAG